METCIKIAEDRDFEILKELIDFHEGWSLDYNKEDIKVYLYYLYIVVIIVAIYLKNFSFSSRKQCLNFMTIYDKYTNLLSKLSNTLLDDYCHLSCSL